MAATCASGACPSGDVQLCTSSLECLDDQTCSAAGTLMGLMVESCQGTAEAGSSSGSSSGSSGAAEAGAAEGGAAEAGAADGGSTPAVPDDAATDAPVGG